MAKFSIVIPLYNEEETLPELIRRLEAVCENTHEPHEIIFVDDGSSDNTSVILGEYAEKNKAVRVIFFSRNFGHQAAITAGIDHAQGDAIIIMDGDLQDPPELIPRFLKKYSEGYDVVYAVRKNRKEQIWKSIAYLLFYRLLRRVASGVHLPLDSGDFSLISRRIAETLSAMPERNRYVRGLRSWVGFRQTGISYVRDVRFAGKSKYSFWKLLKLAYDGIFSFSYFPIALVTTLGFIFSVTSFIGILVVLWVRFVKELNVPGWASTAILILFFGGIQFLALGILGEYIRRIYDETKKRPPYVIDRKLGF